MGAAPSSPSDRHEAAATTTRAPRFNAWTLAALILAVVIVLALLVAPVYEVDPGGDRTFVEQEGLWVLAIAAVPALLALVALLAPRAWQRPATWTAAIFVGAFAMLTGFTIGMFYLPVLALLVITAVAAPRRS